MLLAAAGGIAVANVYYVQPLLQLIADDFHAPARSVGLVSVMMQAGYALGIAAFVPLGDVVQPRRLLVGMYSAVAAATLAIGTCTTCEQVLMPFAADFAVPAQRRLDRATCLGAAFETLLRRS